MVQVIVHPTAVSFLRRRSSRSIYFLRAASLLNASSDEGIYSLCRGVCLLACFIVTVRSLPMTIVKQCINNSQSEGERYFFLKKKRRKWRHFSQSIPTQFVLNSTHIIDLGSIHISDHHTNSSIKYNDLPDPRDVAGYHIASYTILYFVIIPWQPFTQ